MGTDPICESGVLTSRSEPHSRRTALLVDPTRARLHRALVNSPTGRTAADLAQELDLHHTTVRDHLRLLADVGLVDVIPQPPNGRGRPRSLFLALPVPDDSYRDLATMLTSAVRDGLTPEEAGRRAGRRMAGDSDASGVETLAREARRRGFDPVVDPSALIVTLRTCPYAELAETDPDTVCALHLGVVRGVADTVGDVTVESLEAREPRVGGCRVHLSPVSMSDAARGQSAE